MRVIAGEAHGRRLRAPRGLLTRPATARVRASIFSRLAARTELAGTRVLDLFAGSGSLGLEALSRGAARAVFVESDGEAVRAIERNLDKLKLQATVLRRDAIAALTTEAAAGRKYDLVLVDPPYDMYSDLQPQLARYLPAVLTDDGMLVVETDARIAAELPLEERTSRKYGQTRVTVYEK
jgi:16S rRNA (guanine966-N2)-methyltransferase